MKNVYLIADNICSPLGATTAQNFEQLVTDVSGVRRHDDKAMSDEPFFASLFEKDEFVDSNYTKFEQMLIASITDTLKDIGVNLSDKKTALIISTTKGNISLLETEQPGPKLDERIALHTSAKKIAQHFGFVNEPTVVSHACISGLVAMITGMRLIQSDKYDHAVIAGADVISRFVLSGFQSFQAISPELCKPFDVSRNGINLGEGAATVILSAEKPLGEAIELVSGAISNDANHISGPSRTGEELYYAINKAMDVAGLKSAEIDFISAHGTATIYNDDMEAKAITLAGLQLVPLNSLKGFYGHTLGASGLIEAIISARSLQRNLVIPTKGFKEQSGANPVNVCNQLISKPLNNCLKIASGFGGCNAAIILTKSQQDLL
ncbi:beta-ketoacyl synthase N-terminal-like domain-containing protein [Mucilaginibacter sp. cycad4]|uniref:beta-ketoacyl synthase N-terminal-like domain-containing protein n=1 Tax=Mucilaginibacter sp. cycad4 TaxID=3342096 RepID=UPI002AABBAC7|nr:beta-ketoacyl synthase N-terminal-like domain-containing protein [Mucilaginibacter gossypii]WPU98763.1 beta-ketoacyl synthase N-terminal-like domain-containing protein [Mucilaginibacter gossypii]